MGESRISFWEGSTKSGGDKYYGHTSLYKISEDVENLLIIAVTIYLFSIRIYWYWLQYCFWFLAKLEIQGEFHQSSKSPLRKPMT